MASRWPPSIHAFPWKENLFFHQRGNEFDSGFVADVLCGEVDNTPTERDRRVPFFSVRFHPSTGIVTATLTNRNRSTIFECAKDRRVALVADNNAAEAAAINFNADFVFGESEVQSPHTVRMKSEFTVCSQPRRLQLQGEMVNPSIFFGLLMHLLQERRFLPIRVLLLHRLIDRVA